MVFPKVEVFRGNNNFHEAYFQTQRDFSKQLLEMVPGNRYLAVSSNESGEIKLYNMDSGRYPREGILATLTKNEFGEIKITGGKVSLNGTYISGTLLNDSGVFKEGLELSLGKRGIKFCLTGHKGIVSDNPLSKIIEEKISLLDVGKNLVVGRKTIPNLPEEVSVEHLVIERLEDVETKQGKIRSYRVSDGIPSPRGVFIKESDRWRELHGSELIGIGRSFALAGNPISDRDIKTYEVPDPEVIKVKRNQDANRALSAKIDLLSGHSIRAVARQVKHDEGEQNTIVLPGRNPRQEYSANPTELLRARAVGVYVRQGLKLLAEEKYSLAQDHFSDIKVLKEAFPKYQISFETNHLYIAKSLDAEYLCNMINQIASDSWFKTNDQNLTIYPSIGLIHKDLQPKNPQEELNIKNFTREVALLYAEEFTHAYQKCLGGTVSRYGIFLNNDLEADVAQLFRDYSVPMSDLFLSRYDRSKKIQYSRGIQTLAEVDLIKEKLAILNPRESIIIGWNISKQYRQDLIQQIDLKDHQIVFDLDNEKLSNKSLHADRANLRSKINQSGAPQGVRISRLDDGQYLIEGQPQTNVYACDPYGIWFKAVENQITLASGRVRIGKYFEFHLP